jgi:hypothetical protein
MIGATGALGAQSVMPPLEVVVVRRINELSDMTAVHAGASGGRHPAESPYRPAR